MLRFLLVCSTIVGISLANPQLLSANQPPVTPVIIEPADSGAVVSASDVHMVTDPFSDPDAGDTHLCSTWEIWTTTPLQLAWNAICVTGPSAVHIHLGDGTFLNSHFGRTELLNDTQYRLRVRHRDDSSDPSTEWSAWAERDFETGSASQIFPMDIDDILSTPLPEWEDVTGNAVVMPQSGIASVVSVESADGDVLLYVASNDGVTNTIVNPVPLPDHVDVRVVVSAGSGGLVLAESDLAFFDSGGEERTIALPALVLSARAQSVYWVSESGSTFFGTVGQTSPDFSTLARGASVPWRVLEPGYRVEIVSSGYQLPVSIAFVPSPGTLPGDPLYYVGELYGNIKVVTRDGTVSNYATGLLNFNPTGNFPGSGEQGMVGLAVDPLTGDIFATLVYSENPADELAPHHPRIIRLASVDGGLTMATESTVLDMPGAIMSASHQISHISIGPDNMLYAHIGDGFNVPAAQDTTSFLGKIIRLEFDGDAPTDNPFYDNGDGIDATDYVYGYGVRNPFGGAWRNSDSRYFFIDNGPQVDRIAELVGGRNYLHDGTDTSMYNYAIHAWMPSVAPVAAAVIQASTFGGSGFPNSRMGHVYVTESGPTWWSGLPVHGKRISRFDIDGSGTLVGGRNDVIKYNGSGKASCAGLAAGPDGLYFTDLYNDSPVSPIEPGSNVLRIRFVGVADFVGDVTAGTAPQTVAFTNLSTVPSATSWLWYFGDGASSADEHPVHEYTSGGAFTVQLQVAGATGVVVESKTAYINLDFPVAIDPAGRPQRFALGQNVPNPFHDATTVPFELPVAANVEIAVFDVAGRRVASLVSGMRAAGAFTVGWNGVGRAGPVASGIYFTRFSVDGEVVESRKMVITR